MRKAILKKFKVLAAIAIAVLVMTPGRAAAQNQNPIDAIKDAWKKAKDQGKNGQPGQPLPGQPVSGQPVSGQPLGAAQPANAPQARGGAAVNDTGPFTPPAGTKIEPVVMAPLEQGAQFAVSPHGIHVATLSHSGSRQVIIYDGVAGPKFDQIFTGSIPNGVVFSPDGNRYAYCGQSGNQYVVMVDGKELVRSSESNNGVIDWQSCKALNFSPNSKHVYYTSIVAPDVRHMGVRFVFDGKPGPIGVGGDIQSPAFSPDGNHLAYLWSDPNTNPPRTQLFIDGQPAPYNGGDPQWSADSQHLYTKRNVSLPNASVIEVLLDGKPFLRAEWAVLYIPPVGNMVVALVKRGVGRTPTTSFLVIGGKEVPGSEITGNAGIKDVTFSPDGKHYSAVYQDASGLSWVFSDGKKGQTYGGIGAFNTTSSEVTHNYGSTAFTADSSTLVYTGFMAGNARQNYIVYGGQESDEVLGVSDCLFSPVKNHFLTTDSGVVTLDGKIIHLPRLVPQAIGVDELGFSPDGEHYAFRMQAREGPAMVIDGVVQQTGYAPAGSGFMSANNKPYVFSPDSKHIAYFCRSGNPAANPNDVYLCLDNKAVLLGPHDSVNLTFSADSNHLFWIRNEGRAIYRVYVDGKPVEEGFLAVGSGVGGGLGKEAWQLGPDGNLLVLMQDDTSLKRVSITPSPNTSIATLFGGAAGLAAKQ
jgi:WD40 repeat protein